VALEVTSIDQFIGSPFVKITCAGPDSLPASAVIEVGIFPDAEGDAVGVGDTVGVGDALALGDGVTLGAADELDVVVAVVEEVEVFVLATCGLLGVDEVQPATKIVAITVATTSKDRRLFLMLLLR
jgi:hypothetical protein